MKALLAAALLCLGFIPATAQVTLTPYFIVPPSNGCDGLAAFGPASILWQAPCTAPYLYMAAPTGCAQGQQPFGDPLWFSGDTIYTHLCSVPCEITIVDAGGSCVTLCQLSFPNGIAVEAGTGERLLLPGSDLVHVGSPITVDVDGPGPLELELVDAQGRIVERGTFRSQPARMDITRARAGMHVLRARTPNGRLRTQRLMIVQE